MHGLMKQPMIVLPFAVVAFIGGVMVGLRTRVDTFQAQASAELARDHDERERQMKTAREIHDRRVAELDQGLARERAKLKASQEEMLAALKDAVKTQSAPPPPQILFSPIDPGAKTELGLDDETWNRIAAVDQAAVAKSKALVESLRNDTIAPSEFSRAMVNLSDERDRGVNALLTADQAEKLRTYMRQIEKQRRTAATPPAEP